jgi:hypothetical protein
MKVGDLVRYAADNCIARFGLIVAILPSDRILASAVSVVWSSGELVERSNPHILEVISESG